MRRGDFEAAWQVSDMVLAERRTRRENCSRWPRHLQFIWDGSDFDGRHVLVRCYHGLGDTLQYVRLLASLRQRARSVTLWAQQPLLDVLARVRGIDRLLPLHDGVPDVEYDVNIEIMELAHALRITIEDLPGAIPYIEYARTNRCHRTRRSLHVGIVWRSGNWDPLRSIPPEQLRPLADTGIVFHSLQYPPEPLPFETRAMACSDIDVMARRMIGLDLVISVDTMVAHLAGALGLPTWLLLHERPDWRWLEGRDDSPWYPTMRIFRKHTPSWEPAVDEVRQQLIVDQSTLDSDGEEAV